MPPASMLHHAISPLARHAVLRFPHSSRWRRCGTALPGSAVRFAEGSANSAVRDADDDRCEFHASGRRRHGRRFFGSVAGGGGGGGGGVGPAASDAAASNASAANLPSPPSDGEGISEVADVLTYALDLSSMLGFRIDGVANAAAAADPSLALNWYNPAHQVMNIVISVHDLTGFTYATTIAAVTVGLRLAMFPLAVLCYKSNEAREKIRPELRRLVQEEKIRRERGVRTTAEGRMIHRRQLRDLQRRYGYYPIRSLSLPLVSMGSFVCMFLGMRWMGHYFPEEMVTGGFGYILDLSQPDPLNYLPFLSTTLFLFMGEMSADGWMGQSGQNTSARKRWFWRVFRVVVFPLITFNAPAAVHCYWIPNGFMSIGQTMALNHPAIMQRFGIHGAEVAAPAPAWQRGGSWVGNGANVIEEKSGGGEKVLGGNEDVAPGSPGSDRQVTDANGNAESDAEWRRVTFKKKLNPKGDKKRGKGKGKKKGKRR